MIIYNFTQIGLGQSWTCKHDHPTINDSEMHANWRVTNKSTLLLAAEKSLQTLCVNVT